ncbi:urea ABC transporter ATP-binding protein UrtD [Aliarcobacter butzleri]|uniref:Urea ABC transporter ATP-binding protein UrtD n=1 Tax=Aliarcobacter butzleri TaxID=28197 RepID=A0AAP4PZD3_9BACT|nr:urea ABC transporter ATP-binding protein UrtD [Aliarcobacter butzleri]MCG3676056.1 urea ABC transporter ATP-binding protein UrtD [Aliarcobacter butzleri]MCG3704066.1 urea ABC transporter ATP-binding protein UrtD [Aliarcobacter butzleri]MDK2091074.1 urea ABC transporter ATP-binding protein UrtD [Aliarcobacter butzleri]MDN5052546.1 urea ABC transporter ATP-binding protein UrtD [Aliarcobacter butzleri]MDN5075180.1 urea ABC transporter ATP-binding protein UrtD [Aliarcobacter butzleri]
MKPLELKNEDNIGDLRIGSRILLVDGVSVSFDGFKALNNLSFSINYGELRCIIGANGAGKSTMMDVVTGKTKPDSGEVIFGQAVNLLSMDEPSIAQIGIGRKFQKPTVFANHTVFENLELAMKDDKRFFKTLFSRLSSTQKDKIEETMKLIGLKELYNQEAGILSHGQKQWLEIGMLIMQEPKLLLVDEPVAGMTPQEVEKTAEILTTLSKENAVVVVEHDMEFIRSIAKKVTVLHEGSVLAEGSMDAIQNNEQVRKVYLGE